MQLAERESEIAGWLAAGKTNLKIGLILGVNVRTVENILRRLGGESDNSSPVIGGPPRTKQSVGFKSDSRVIAEAAPKNWRAQMPSSPAQFGANS